MNGKLFFGLILIFLCFACGVQRGARLYITGDAQAVGAKVYIDGQEVGSMVKEVYKGPENESPSLAGKVFSRGVDLRKENHSSYYDEIISPFGKHVISFEKEGEKISKEFTITGETYISVDFQNENIIGG